MDDRPIRIVADKSITPADYAALMGAVGWGEAAEYDPAAIERSLAAYPLIVQARDPAGRLVGYVSAFSDGSFSTFIGELVVHPDHQRDGLGTQLLERVEREFPGVPIYAFPFRDVSGFFLRRGYRHPGRAMNVLWKIPA